MRCRMKYEPTENEIGRSARILGGRVGEATLQKAPFRSRNTVSTFCWEFVARGGAVGAVLRETWEVKRYVIDDRSEDPDGSGT